MIFIKSSEEIKTMEEGGEILAKILREVKKIVKPGISTKELDKVAYDLVLRFGAKPSFLGYKKFPASLCVSVNEQIVHGIPSNRVLLGGDIVTLDFGVLYKGFHTDAAITLPVGKIDRKLNDLIKATRKALELGVKEIAPEKSFGDIGFAIQDYARRRGFNVIKELCGHGIGREVHEDPEVLNFGEKGTGPKIKEGMVFCLEPMLTMGKWRIREGKDGYSFETVDASLSAHFEQTVAVTKKGCKILTNI